MGAGFNDFSEYLEQVSDLRRGEGIRSNIQVSETLMRRRHIDYNRAIRTRAYPCNLRGLRKRICYAEIKHLELSYR